MLQLDFRAMGCQMRAVVGDDSVAAAAMLRQVPAWFEAWEQALSRFRPDSELSCLNRHAGQPRRVSLVLWQVVVAALRAAWASDGLVDPTVLGALEAAGYDRPFGQLQSGGELAGAGRPRGECPEQPAVRLAEGGWTAGAWRRIRLDQRRRAVLLPRGTRLDLGGVAKGWAADRAARDLGRLAPCLVDAGGDVAASAPPPDLPGWPIGVADPRQADAQLALLSLARGGVATSGRDVRRWRRDGVWQHHLIDPRTGRPAETDVLSATVVAPSAEAAETAAKTVLLLGRRKGVAWLNARPRLAGLLVTDDGRTIASRRLGAYLWE